MALGSGQGSTSCVVKGLGLALYKSLLVDISSPSCPFPQEHLASETGLLAVDLAKDSHGTTSAEVRPHLFESFSGAYGYLLTYGELLTQVPFLQGL